jgi:hypothetical protein
MIFSGRCDYLRKSRRLHRLCDGLEEINNDWGKDRGVTDDIWRVGVRLLRHRQGSRVYKAPFPLLSYARPNHTVIYLLLGLG